MGVFKGQRGALGRGSWGRRAFCEEVRACEVLTRAGSRGLSTSRSASGLGNTPEQQVDNLLERLKEVFNVATNEVTKEDLVEGFLQQEQKVMRKRLQYW